MTDHSKSTIAILGGTGDQGPGLALRWAAAGHHVIIGSRMQEKAQAVAAELNGILGRPAITGLQNRDAAAQADIVVLTIPYAGHQATLETVKDVVQGKIFVDVTVPLSPSKPIRFHPPPEGSATAQAQVMLGPDVRVVCAFQNVSAHLLRDLEAKIDCDILVCGNDKEARQTVMRLAQDAGLDAFDAGPLDHAATVEALTALLIGINMRYKVRGAGIRVTNLPRNS